MEQKIKKSSILMDGILRENPVFILLLGTCPTLAISNTVEGSISMGIAVILVLICSNILISLIKNIISDKIRIPAYIVIIAGFVSIVEMIVKTYFPAINDLLGIYLPLIVVNCIILGRAEMFAGKNTVVNSAIDGLAMGIGFTLAIFLISSIREIIGKGTWLGLQVIPESVPSMGIFISPAGGFFVFGVSIALVSFITKRGADKNCQDCLETSKGGDK